MTTDKRERFTLRIPPELYKELSDKAKEYGVSLNALILEILREWKERQ